MRVGFHLHYKDGDLCQAMFRLAAFARDRGHEATIHTPGRMVRQVNPAWDRFVASEADHPYLSWVRDVQILVAMEPVSTEHFTGAARHGVKIVLLAPWDTVKEDLKECYQMADLVVAPSQQGTELLRENWGLTNCVHIPWDNGLPATRKGGQIDPDRVKVLFPMHGWQSGVTHPDMLNVAWRLLHKCPFVDATVLFNPKSLTTTAFKSVRRIGKTFAESGQFKALSDRRLTRDELLMLYARNDVVAWAAEQEGLALVGLDALAMGTPVVAYDVAPQNEYLHDRRNAVLVPCELQYNWLGVPWVKTNAEEFERHLEDLVGSPKALGELRRFTRFGMASRRERFVNGWRDVLALR